MKHITSQSSLYHSTQWRMRDTDNQNKSEQTLFSHAQRADRRSGIKTVLACVCGGVVGHISELHFLDRHFYPELARLRVVLVMGTWLRHL